MSVAVLILLTEPKATQLLQNPCDNKLQEKWR